MATIVTRAGKGSPLTNTEVDANFTNLNTDKAELSGATFTGEIVANAGIALGDADRATFGAGDDLQIYHDGSNSIITDTGTGYLNLSTNGAYILLTNADNNSNLAYFEKGGGSHLYWNGSSGIGRKLATTSTGIDVTGTATMDTLTSSSTIKVDHSGALLAAIQVGDPTTLASDTGVYFRTSGIAHLTIPASGNLCIDGTSNQKFANFSGNGDISFYEDTGSTPKLFWDASAESLGIGTSSPSSALEVVGGASLGSGFTQSRSGHPTFGITNGGTDSVYFSLAPNGGSHQAFMQVRDDDTDVSSVAFSTSGSERLRIDSSGNVGIGTSSPATSLHVNSGANGEILRLQGADAQLRINNSTSNVMDINSSGSGDSLTLSTGDTAALTINSSQNATFSGSVGIGTSSPTTLLELKSTSATAGLSITGSNAHTSDINMGDTDDINIQRIRSDHSNNSLQFTTNNAERMRIDSSGALLVGCTAFPSASVKGLAIRPNGTAGQFIQFGVSLTQGVTVQQFQNPNGVIGQIKLIGSATQYLTSSDQRLKENIADADDAGSKIDAIQVRKFDWKADGSHQDYGMIAQELQTVAPEAVSVPEDSEEMMGVDYSKLVPMLIKEIQSLRNRVAQLEG